MNIGVALIIWAVVWGLGLYMIIHFITKYW